MLENTTINNRISDVKITDYPGRFLRPRFFIMVVAWLIFTTSALDAQESTVDNITGNWTLNSTWVDGTSPGTTGLSGPIDIFGTISGRSKRSPF